MISGLYLDTDIDTRIHTFLLACILYDVCLYTPEYMNNAASNSPTSCAWWIGSLQEVADLATRHRLWASCFSINGTKKNVEKYLQHYFDL